MNERLNWILASTSALLAVITFWYVGRAFRQSGRPSDIPYEWFPIAIPVIYGLFITLTDKLEVRWPLNAIISGMLMGLTLSTIGRFYLGLPTKIFHFTESNQWQVHLWAMALYSVIMVLITGLARWTELYKF